MNRSFHILCVVAFFLAATSADCNVCNPANNLACYSKNQYQICANNMPNGTISKCPKGYVCASETVGVICLLEASDKTACAGCSKCDSTKTFACTGTKSFALCLGETEPSQLTGQCTDGNVCNVNEPKICVPLTTKTPTCSYADDAAATTTTTTTTTTAAPVLPPTSDPEVYCTVLKSQDYFPVGKDPATTCRQYIYCYQQQNNNWTGRMYTCPTALYYNSASKQCEKTMPATCSAEVASLSFRGILLD